MDLCGSSSLSSSVSHPTKSDERLFLLFDFTHNMKNIFNNFVSRKTMYIPETADEQIFLEEGVSPSLHTFSDSMLLKSASL